jgi:hypothetical protein
MISYTGNRGTQSGGEDSDVVCAWCGGVIRTAAAKAASYSQFSAGHVGD